MYQIIAYILVFSIDKMSSLLNILPFSEFINVILRIIININIFFIC